MPISNESIPMVIAMGDQTYAWQLLQSEIRLQTASNLTGPQISHLLTLYMKGVQRLNSIADQRQQYFQSKITQLMGNPNVIELLTSSKQSQPKNKGILLNTPNHEEIVERKKNLEQNLSRQLLNDTLIYSDILAEHERKATSIKEKVNQLITSSGNKLENRIMQRKIKSLSARSNHDSMYQQVIQSFKGKLDNMTDSGSKHNENLNHLNRSRTSSSKDLHLQSSKRRNTCHTYKQAD